MPVISLLVEFWTILCLPLLAGQALARQSEKDGLQKLADRYYRLEALKMSNDGRWLTVRKSYESNIDTVLIFNIENTEQPVSYKDKVSNIVFLNKNYILIQRPLQAELFNPEGKKSQFFNDVKQIQVLNNNTMFLIHYTEKEQNRLELRDNCGKILNSLNEVDRFYTSDNDLVYAIIKDGDSSSVIILLRVESTKKIYSTSNKISYLEPMPKGKGLMIYEQKTDNISQEVIFLDITTGAIFPLKEVLPTSVKNGFTEAVNGGDSFYLSLQIPYEKGNNSLVDIWYGNDNKLEEKFYPPVREVNFLWKPKENKLWRIGNDNLTTNINIGSARYFLSFDQYYLQDYTAEYPLLQIYVYDIIRDNYSALAITRNIYFSDNGEYAAYQRNGEWIICHIPSGKKMTITAEGLEKPWFTFDGTSVLFEGDGAIWKYEIKSGLISEVAAFKGYKTSFVNGEIDGISTRKGIFSKTRVNDKDPLVIRLYEPQENKTSYVLYYKGGIRVIVPPTTFNIQFMTYNRTYDCFSWIEEDYNIPPRMVLNDVERKDKIIFQSNENDKDILKLKQKIIPYTNMDGMVLNGILYYPIHFDSSASYPMIVHVYEKQRHLSNVFPFPSYHESIGFNIRLLLEKGYFVYLPDILIQGKAGPGMDALDCVNSALDALAGVESIDNKRIGLIGHSFGGYETDFIATHSDRFAAYVSGSGHIDIIWAYHAFNYNFLFPDYVRIENNQYEMGLSFTEKKILYFENNPLYYTENVNAPILLWSGLDDKNVTSDHSMAFYNALRKNKKTVIALFYKDEGHGLNNPLAQVDLTSKILDWFDYFLKNGNHSKWIIKGLD